MIGDCIMREKLSLEEFNEIEVEQRALLENQRFQEFDDYYIFEQEINEPETTNYNGYFR